MFLDPTAKFMKGAIPTLNLPKKSISGSKYCSRSSSTIVKMDAARVQSSVLSQSAAFEGNRL